MTEWVSAGKVRMTPKGIHDPTNTYNVLDLVSNTEQNIYYIAKQDVPANVQVTNTTYWGIVADMSDCLPDFLESIAPNYEDMTFPIEKGTLVVYAQKLYVANSDISTSEEWDSTHWNETTVADELESIVPVENGNSAGSVQTKSFIRNNNTIEQTASGIGSFAEGYDTVASGLASHAEGESTNAIGDDSHSEGLRTATKGNYSHAEGNEVITIGNSSHIEGSSTNINCRITGAENATTYTVSNASSSISGVILGSPILVRSINKVAIISAVDKANNTITVSSTFGAALSSEKAIIFKAYASGAYSHVEGMTNIADYQSSHAEGNGTMAIGIAAHAEGVGTKSINSGTHSEGTSTIAKGNYSHAENYYTISYGENSHVENQGETYSLTVSGSAESTTYTYTNNNRDPAVGDAVRKNQYCSRVTAVDTVNKTFTVDTTLHYQFSSEGLLFYCSGAFGKNSHAEGKGTTALGSEQHVQGRYNIADADDTYAEIVGNGTAHNSRSNARTLDWLGNEELAGGLTLGKDTANEVTITAEGYSGLRNDIDAHYGSIVVSPELESGSISAEGQPYYRNDRIRTVDYIDLSEYEGSVTIPENHAILPAYYNSDKVWQENGSWLTECSVSDLENYPYVRLIIRNNQHLNDDISGEIGVISLGLTLKNKSNAQLTAEIRGVKQKVKNAYVHPVSAGAAPIVSIVDGAEDMPLSNHVVNFYPVQSGSGDPAPNNVRPISGWTGMNITRCGRNIIGRNGLVSSITMNSVTATMRSDGSSYVLNGTATARSDFYIIPYGSYDWQSGNYMLSVNEGLDLNDGADYIYISIIDNEGIIRYVGTSSFTQFTLASNEKIRGCFIRVANGKTLNNVVVTPQIEFSSIDTPYPYEPYTGKTILVDWTDETGTAYGGYVDLVNGEVVAEWAEKTLTQNDTYTIDTWEERNRVAWYDYMTLGKLNGTFVCDRLKTIENGQGATGDDVWEIFGSVVAPRCWITVPTSISSKDDFKAWVAENPVKIIYELATPIHTPITPVILNTLYGANNIWSNSNGDTSIEYSADVKLYIDRLTAPEEDDMIANSQIPSGKYFMVGNNLYLSTTTIPAGDTINPGTNCLLTNLAAALNALNA